VDDALKIMAALTPIILGVLTYYTAKANSAAKSAAEDARNSTKRVERTLAQSTDATTTQLGEIHTLVNSRLTEALKKIDRLEAKLLIATGEMPTGEPPPVT